MSWIKLETHTFDKVEVYSIAEELGIDADSVIGKCCRVWAWFDSNTVDGVTPSVTKALLDRQCGVIGFCKAMINAKWMTDDGKNLSLPNYDRHNSKTAKSRALGAIRQSRYKSNAQGDAQGDDASVTGALPKSSHREEERREEKNIKTFVPSDAGDNFPVVEKPQCPHQEIIALYHQVLPQCPRIRDWTPARAVQLRARWNEDEKRQSLDWWKKFFEYIAQSDFLTGRTAKPFFADLEWITKSKNFVKIREGNYENKGSV